MSLTGDRRRVEDAVTGADQVASVDWTTNRKLFAKRTKVFSRRISGTNRRIKWYFLTGLLAVYYLLPWIRWDRGANAPDQATLLDLPGRRFYFFAIEIWPQEIYYFTGILILAAVGLFFVTSLFGRVWCAWGCPQTVWTDLFMLVERWIEGDRNSRIRLDRASWTVAKVWRRFLKHVAWILISMATGGAWIFYFVDAPTYAPQIFMLDAPMAPYLTIAFFTGSTYLLAGFAREQVCAYMCPYARFQSVMMDDETWVVTYRAFRGEERGPHKKGQTWDGRGDCIDCTLCVAVCPTGIDIRNGQQVECISCGLCIDACDQVMERVDRPKGLIARDSLANVLRGEECDGHNVRFFRPRALVYSAILLIVVAIMGLSFFTRADTDLNVLRDRNPLFVTLSDGSIRNGYTVRILNKQHNDRRLMLRISGLPEGATVRKGQVPVSVTAGIPLAVGPDDTSATHLFVTLPRSAVGLAASEFEFLLNEADEIVATYTTVFRGPGT